MQFQVPQFIETEDHIVGPLTLRQFLIMGGAAILCGITFAILNIWLWAVLSVVIMGFSAVFALVKIHGRSFGRIFLSAVNFYWKPQTYVWMPNNDRIEKTSDSIQKVSETISIEKIVAGLALSTVWQTVQTGKKEAPPDLKDVKPSEHMERFQVFSKLSGEQKVAKRVDYR